MIPDPSLNIWEHSRQLISLCRRRALDLEPEMDCAGQGADLLAPYLEKPGRKVLDVGCGGGHFYHSLVRRGFKADYHGLDYSPSIVEVARKSLEKFGLEPAKIKLQDVCDLSGLRFDAVVMINTLSFNPDFRAPLDRLTQTKAKVIVIRDNFGPKTVIKWETDGFLDRGFNHLKGYWNQWSKKEIESFLASLGYSSSFVSDSRTKGKIEMVVGKPYRWSWLVAKRL
jgi:SAM-dependent methyltransferase